jgi:hypothetical protein
VWRAAQELELELELDLEQQERAPAQEPTPRGAEEVAERQWVPA